MKVWMMARLLMDSKITGYSITDLEKLMGMVHYLEDCSDSMKACMMAFRKQLVVDLERLVLKMVPHSESRLGVMMGWKMVPVMDSCLGDAQIKGNYLDC